MRSGGRGFVTPSRSNRTVTESGPALWRETSCHPSRRRCFIRPEAVWELKAQALRKNNLLTLHRGGERFDGLGGLDSLKDFCRRALAPRSPLGHEMTQLNSLRAICQR